MMPQWAKEKFTPAWYDKQIVNARENAAMAKRINADDLANDFVAEALRWEVMKRENETG